MTSREDIGRIAAAEVIAAAESLKPVSRGMKVKA